MRKGKKSTLTELDNSTKVKELKQEEVYKYLGVKKVTEYNIPP